MSATDSSRGPTGNRQATAFQFIVFLSLPPLVSFFAIALVFLILREPDRTPPVLLPLRIAGTSMRETLHGNEYLLTCTMCGAPITYAADASPADLRLHCFQCGEAAQYELRPEGVRLGDAVRVAPWPDTAPPVRGELVALWEPGGNGRWAVKRIAGLPGETIAVRHGDLYANDSLVQKSWSEFAAVAVLVHDDQFQPRDRQRFPPRWTDSLNAPSRLGSGRSGNDREVGNWLHYRHVWTYSGAERHNVEIPVRDFQPSYPEIGRDLNLVTDLGLTWRMTLGPTSHVVVVVDNGRESFRIHLQADHEELQVERANEASRSVPTFPGATAQGVERSWGVALCDERLLLMCDGRPLAALPYQPGPTNFTPTAHPFALGATVGPLHVNELRVWRDLYLLHPDGSGRDWQRSMPLGDDELFVLGDHPAASVDSRHWPPGSVTRTSLRGRVIVETSRTTP